jgi:cobyric acid synthase
VEIPQLHIETRAACRNRQYDLLADAVREALDMKRIYEIMEEYADEDSPRGN